MTEQYTIQFHFILERTEEIITTHFQLIDGSAEEPQLKKGLGLKVDLSYIFSKNTLQGRVHISYCIMLGGI